VPDQPTGPGPGPGRGVRATRALVAAVLVVLVLVTLVTALLGHGQGGQGGQEGARGSAPMGAPEPRDGASAGGTSAGADVTDLPPLLRPLPDLAGGRGTAPPSEAGLARALGPVLADPALGPRVSAAVVDAVTGELLYSVSPAGDPAVLPASTSKIVTGAAALVALDPARRLTTRVVAGAVPGEVVLVGGGDPTLASPAADPDLRYGGTPPARLAALADATAARLAERGVGEVSRLLVDATLFAPPEPAPGWKPTYLSNGNVAPVVALSVDAGRVRPGRLARHAEPDLAAGESFAALLRERGVPVAAVERGEAPGTPPEATVLAEAASPPVGALVEAMLSSSDNDIAEALARHVALALDREPSAAGAPQAVREAVGGVDIAPGGVDPALGDAHTAPGAGALGPGDVRVADGSGLSRDSRVRPEAVARLVAAATRPEHADLRPLVTGLPAAGFAGTLAERYREGPQSAAAGEVWAKTGTLSGVSALAGLVVDAEGRLLAFDVTADAVPTPSPRPAEAALDRVAATLAACGCD
jgi:D-alanyl-D-alanine carboxypeptidase/D-alanyl-D-alanine-endopeptidase (penicillin-binding protein 4)